MEKFNNIPELFAFLFRELKEKGIEYFVSWSFALNIYTIPRMTRDIDIVIGLNNKNREAFFSIFSEDFYLNKEAITGDILNFRIFPEVIFI